MATHGKLTLGCICALALTNLACNDPNGQPQRKRQAQAITNAPFDSGKTVKWPDTPDFEKHIAPLLSFVERNKLRPAFDTDIAFDDQGFGPVDNYYNFVKAGNLFSDKLRHMLLFYDFAERDYMPLARMAVYVEDKREL